MVFTIYALALKIQIQTFGHSHLVSRGPIHESTHCSMQGPRRSGTSPKTAPFLATFPLTLVPSSSLSLVFDQSPYVCVPGSHVAKLTRSRSDPVCVFLYNGSERSLPQHRESESLESSSCTDLRIWNFLLVHFF